jgi:predicted ATPase
MLHTLAIENYRSLRSIVLPLKQLNIIKGVNGSGKSNLYKALRLLADTAAGGIVSSLAREGGLQSTFWAGLEKTSRAMRAGHASIQGTLRKDRVRLKLGFSSDDFGYCITMGLPVPSKSAFALDPEIKRECIWSGPLYKPERMLVDRSGPSVRARTDKGWQTLSEGLDLFETMFVQVADPNNAPEVLLLREQSEAGAFMIKCGPIQTPHADSRNLAHAHLFLDMMAQTWPQRSKRLLRWATRTQYRRPSKGLFRAPR